MEVHPLRAFRERRGLSQKALADLLHVDRVTVTRWEAGSRKPDQKLLPAIAEKTGIPPRDLRPDLAELASLLGDAE